MKSAWAIVVGLYILCGGVALAQQPLPPATDSSGAACLDLNAATPAQQLQRAEADSSYVHCLSNLAAEQMASCGPQPPLATTPAAIADASNWRGCVQMAQMLDNLAVDVPRYQQYSAQCASTKAADACAAAKNLAQLMQFSVDSAAGGTPALPPLPTIRKQ